VDRLRKKLKTAEKEKTELENVRGLVSCLAMSPRALKSVVNTYSCTDQPIYRLGE
jgi:hypothetical protein